jgi:hypothetical protein
MSELHSFWYVLCAVRGRYRYVLMAFSHIRTHLWRASAAWPHRLFCEQHELEVETFQECLRLVQEGLYTAAGKCRRISATGSFVCMRSASHEVGNLLSETQCCVCTSEVAWKGILWKCACFEKNSDVFWNFMPSSLTLNSGFSLSLNFVSVGCVVGNVWPSFSTRSICRPSVCWGAVIGPYAASLTDSLSFSSFSRREDARQVVS